MPHSVTPPRYAHAEGFTAVAFGQGGDFICTGGSDSLLRVFYSSKVERDQEAITLEQHSDNVLSLAVSRSKIVSGDEEGVVLCFDVGTSTRDEGGKLAVEPSGTVLRSTLPARDISISGNERQVAVATDDEKLVVVSLLDTSVLHTLDGHRGSVNSVSYSPDSTYLASTGCNGTVRVWDMRGDEPSCVSVLHKAGYVCEPGSSMDQSKARWSPDGRFIAVPGSGHTIKLVERGTWQIATELGGVHSKMVSHVAWSSNSKYLASVGLDGHVVVWDVTARASILTHAVSGSLCQVDWNPRGNMLAFTDGAGAMYIWDDVIPLDQGHAPPYERHPVARGTAAGSADDGTTSTLLGGLFDDNADEDTGPGAEVDDDDGGDDDIDDGEALDDFVVDDDHGGYAEHHVPRWTASDAQAHAFQPGSTPWIDGRRYLALNMVGSVAAVAQDSYNTIEIEFHDKSLHRDMHFSDSFRFSLAALADAGCLFATTTRELANDRSLRSGTDDAESVLSFRAFSPWSSGADWMFKLPPREHPRCIAASSHGAAAVTSLGMLRLFSCGGVQRHIESLPGRVVTCVARNDMLLLVLEALGTLKSNMGARRLEYEYILMSIDGQTRLASGCCPVTPAGEIVWAGFSEEGHPATCDSKGMLRVLHRYWAARDACWVPVLDTRRLSHERGSREAFWPVALSACQFIVVTCKNKSRFPPFPRPILDELDVEIPLLHTDTSVGQQEAKLLASQLFGEQQSAEAERTASEYPGGASAQARDDLEQDKLLLRLIQLACKADKTQRAVDLALMIKLDRSFDAAIKIAVHQKQATLAERLMRMKESKFSNENEDYASDSDDDTSQRDSTTAAALNARRHRPPVATYGQKRSNDDSGKDNSDMDLSEDGGDSGQPAKPSGMAAAVTGDDASELAVVRPAKPPMTSKPFNPFGVATPSTSMDIKRSDSFFNAADLHSKCLSQESSATASSGKREPSAEDGAPRKQAKISAFAFKKKAPVASDDGA